MSKGSLAVFQGVGLVLVASPPATVKPDRFDESEAGVLKVVPEAPWLFLSTYGWDRMPRNPLSDDIEPKAREAFGERIYRIQSERMWGQVTSFSNLCPKSVGELTWEIL